ncbi:MAG: Holliday junction branch migration protein RuvA [Planctomycetota bacterium]|jgi:Holliday junction DNA helicase RuvA
MFAFLRGILHEKTPGVAVVAVGGVGYEVRIPLSTFYELGDVGEVVPLRITTLVREDAIQLYGFLTEGEQRLFQHLVSVSGVGARMALAVLSGMSVDEAAAALAGQDVARLQAVPGIGRKTAERLVVELKDRARTLLEQAREGAAPAPAAAGVRADVVSALVNLGYPEGPAARATDRTLAESGEGTLFESLLRGTLQRLHRK